MLSMAGRRIRYGSGFAREIPATGQPALTRPFNITHPIQHDLKLRLRRISGGGEKIITHTISLALCLIGSHQNIHFKCLVGRHQRLHARMLHAQSEINEIKRVQLRTLKASRSYLFISHAPSPGVGASRQKRRRLRDGVCAEQVCVRPADEAAAGEGG